MIFGTLQFQNKINEKKTIKEFEMSIFLLNGKSQLENGKTWWEKSSLYFQCVLGFKNNVRQ